MLQPLWHFIRILSSVRVRLREGERSLWAGHRPLYCPLEPVEVALVCSTILLNVWLMVSMFHVCQVWWNHVRLLPMKTADGVPCNWPRLGFTPTPGCHFSWTDGFVPSSILKPQNPAMRQILGQYGFVSGTYPVWLSGRSENVRSLLVAWLSGALEMNQSLNSFWMGLAVIEHASISMSLAKFSNEVRAI